MNTSSVDRLTTISVVDVTGADAAAIVHNVTTNAVKTLPLGAGCETFITEVRGRILGHGYLYRLPDRLRLIGAAGQSERIAAHVDRYTIREDATASVRDDEFATWVFSAAMADALGIHAPVGSGPMVWQQSLAGQDVSFYRTAWLGPATCVALVSPEQDRLLAAYFRDHGIAVAGQEAFENKRVLAGFPWYGTDLDESNLPQEADRDSLAVSFNKGCYLGQETVARLDALGQVQKKLVRWSITGCVPVAGSKLIANDKVVGRLTSVAEVEGDAVAMGMARRTHFEPGSVATGTDDASGKAFTGTVLDHGEHE